MLSVNVPSMPDLDTASDTGPSTTDNNTNDNTPTFNGTSDANSLVKVGAWVDGNANTVIEDSEVSNIVEAITNGSGNYSATLGTLADGNYQIVAKAYDELGNPSEGSNNGWSNPLSIVIDTTIAATTTDLATASDSVSPNTVLPGTNTDDVTNIDVPVFQGTAEPGATIEVFDGANSTPIATATANETGNWVTSPLAVALTDGVHSITARATDGFGNMSTSGPLLVTIDTIVSINAAPGMTAATDSGSSSTDNITNDNTPTFTGMTEDDAPRNAYVELLLDGTTVIATGNASSGAWTLTPAGAISDGTHTVEARVTDHAGNVNTSEPITIVIDTVSPNAVNDAASTNEDTPVTLNVVANDTDTIDPSLTVTGVTNGSNGTVVNNDNGTVTYTPNLNFNGTDTFTYTITDDGGLTDTATVNITVNPVNDAPAAVNDTASTNEDTPVTTVNVLANDTDVDERRSRRPASRRSPKARTARLSATAMGRLPTRQTPTSTARIRSPTRSPTATSSNTATVNITVNPSVVVTGPSSANDGQTLTYTFTTTDPVAVGPYTRTITSSNPLDVVTPVSFNPTTGSGSFTVKFHGPVGTSTSILTVNVSEAGGAPTGSGTLSRNCEQHVPSNGHRGE